MKATTLALAPLLLLGFLASQSPAQTLHPVGYRDLSLANTTTKGSKTLKVRVHYPATKAGQNAPILPKKGGWPVVVFLHGFGGLGSNYPDLANRLAARGRVLVMSETARFTPDLQRDDGKALFPTLAAENKKNSSLLFGALDMKRAAVMGHSMGAGNTLRVLAENPGYRCGVALAPWDGKALFTNYNYPPTYGPKIKTPFLILHGEGDTRLDWKTTALRWFQASTKVGGLGAFWLFDKACDHKNVARLLSGATKTDREVFAKILAFSEAWLDRYLRDQPQALEGVLSPALLPGKYLRRLYLRVGAPAFWLSGSQKLGSALGLRLLGEPGPGLILFAAKTGNLATPWGSYLLDPQTSAVLSAAILGAPRSFSLGFTIPQDPALIGLRIPFQGLAQSSLQGLRLSNAQGLQLRK